MTFPDGPDRSIADLAELHRAGALTDEEFAAARAAVLHQNAPPFGEMPTGPTPAAAGFTPLPEPPLGEQPPPSGEQPGPAHHSTWLIVAGIAVAALAVAA